MANKQLTVEEYADGIQRGDRSVLARAITLVESNAEKHLDLAQEVLRQVMPRTGQSVRLGITGVPGAGKSTFIEALGNHLCESGHHVAVLAVDPSSSLTRGSIMADKTRMENLSRHPNAFIRPSPSGGALGGVARKTRETLLICEAAGFDIIIVETVGVGQSETMVSTMVDFFLLLTLTGAGDELQNIKKGVIELADAILINKADGDNKLAAERMRVDLNQALHYLSHPVAGWSTEAFCCSALTGEGIPDIWDTITRFHHLTKETGDFDQKRRQQTITWLNEIVTHQIRSEFFQNPDIISLFPRIKEEVARGDIPVTTAATTLLKIFRRSQADSNPTDG